MNMDHVSLASSESTVLKYTIYFAYIIVYVYDIYYYYISMKITDYNHYTQDNIRFYLMSTMVSII